MIKPTALLLLSALFTLPSSSTAAETTAPLGEAERAASSRRGALPLLAPSRLLRGAGAVAVASPSEERALSQIPPPNSICFLFQGGMYGVPCPHLSCYGPTCCADSSACMDEATEKCSAIVGLSRVGAYELSGPNETGCTWQYTCCATNSDDYPYFAFP